MLSPAKKRTQREKNVLLLKLYICIQVVKNLKNLNGKRYYKNSNGSESENFRDFCSKMFKHLYDKFSKNCMINNFALLEKPKIGELLGKLARKGFKKIVI